MDAEPSGVGSTGGSTAAGEPIVEVADLRAWAGLSQQELADRAGVVRATYALVERAELPLRPEVAQELARALGRRVREVELAYGRTARRRREA